MLRSGQCTKISSPITRLTDAVFLELFGEPLALELRVVVFLPALELFTRRVVVLRLPLQHTQTSDVTEQQRAMTSQNSSAP